MKSISMNKIASLSIFALAFTVAFIIAITYGFSSADASGDTADASGDTQVRVISDEVPVGGYWDDYVVPEYPIEVYQPEYQVNDLGLTYGPAPVRPGYLPGSVWPVLLAAEASNGRSGYIYYRDSFGAPEPATPEESIRAQEAQTARNSQFFTALLFKRMGVSAEFDVNTSLLAYEAAARYAYAPRCKAWAPNPEFRNILKEILGASSAALPDGEALQKLLTELLTRTWEQGGPEIPVYESDGVTQIGVFSTRGGGISSICYCNCLPEDLAEGDVCRVFVI